MDQGYFCLAYCLCSLHANLLVQSQMHAKKKKCDGLFRTGYFKEYLI